MRKVNKMKKKYFLVFSLFLFLPNCFIKNNLIQEQRQNGVCSIFYLHKNPKQGDYSIVSYFSDLNIIKLKTEISQIEKDANIIKQTFYSTNAMLVSLYSPDLFALLLR
jgi:hypothetical protein